MVSPPHCECRWPAACGSTQDRALEAFGGFVPAQALLEAQRRLVLAAPERVVAQHLHGSCGEAVVVGADDAGLAVADALGDAAFGPAHRRHAERLRLTEREAE